MLNFRSIARIGTFSYIRPAMNLEDLRAALAVSDRPEIARRSGVAYRTIDNIIHRRYNQTPRATTIAALERALRRRCKPSTKPKTDDQDQD